MTVAQLQQTLRELTQLLRSAGVKDSTAAELTSFLPALDKFGGQTVKGFGELLDRVDPSGGVVPKPGRTTGRAVRVPKADPAVLGDEAADLYGRAADRSLPDDRYYKLFADLQGLDKGGLLAVAGRLDLRPSKAANKPKLLDDICKRIEDRRGATLRRNMLDRPVAG